MTQFTRNDLALRVLLDLNIVDSDSIPQDSDMKFVLQTIGSEMALMRADGIKMDSTSADSINEIYFTELSRRIGFAVGPTFGVLSASTAEAGVLASERRLRSLSQPTKTPELLVVERAARGARIRDPIISQ